MKVKIIIAILFLILIFQISAYGLSSEKVKEDITSALRDYISENYTEWEEVQIEVAYKYADETFADLAAKNIDLDFKIVPLYYNYKPIGNVILAVDIFSKGKKVDKVYIRARVEIIKDVVVAKRTLKRGIVIEKSDLSLEPRDISRISHYYSSLDNLLGMETTTIIPSGRAVKEAMVREKPVIAKYDEVDIVVNIANLKVKARGKALQDGYTGKKIKVQNLITKKYLEAIVLNSSEVKVEVN